MKRLYICTQDRQGGSFALGAIHTIEGWRDRAMSWCDQDDNDVMYSYLEVLKDEEVIPTIDDYWELTIEPLDELIPSCNDGIVSDIYYLLEYMLDNCVALREMQGFLNQHSEEYAELTENILNKANSIIGEVCGRGDEE